MLDASQPSAAMPCGYLHTYSCEMQPLPTCQATAASSCSAAAKSGLLRQRPGRSSGGSCRRERTAHAAPSGLADGSTQRAYSAGRTHRGLHCVGLLSKMV